MGQFAFFGNTDDAWTQGSRLTSQTFVGCQLPKLAVIQLGPRWGRKVFTSFHHNHFAGGAPTLASAGMHPIYKVGLHHLQYRVRLIGRRQFLLPQIFNCYLYHQDQFIPATFVTKQKSLKKFYSWMKRSV